MFSARATIYVAFAILINYKYKQFNMIESLASLFEVSIDFDESHLYFPRIVISSIVTLLIMIAFIYRQRVIEIVKNPARELSFFKQNADKFRLFSTIVLVVIYFIAMEQVGMLLPNTGLSFLICSVGFVFALSLVYVHEYTRRTLTIISANAVIAPTVAWYVLGSLFDITLP